MTDRFKAWLTSPGDIAGIVFLALMALSFANDLYGWAFDLTRQVGASPAFQVALALLPIAIVGVPVFYFFRRLIARVHSIERAAERIAIRDLADSLLLAMVARAARCDPGLVEQEVAHVRRSVDNHLDGRLRKEANDVVDQLMELIRVPRSPE